MEASDFSYFMENIKVQEVVWPRPQGYVRETRDSLPPLFPELTQLLPREERAEWPIFGPALPS